MSDLYKYFVKKIERVNQGVPCFLGIQRYGGVKIYVEPMQEIVIDVPKELKDVTARS